MTIGPLAAPVAEFAWTAQMTGELVIRVNFGRSFASRMHRSCIGASTPLFESTLGQELVLLGRPAILPMSNQRVSGQPMNRVGSGFRFQVLGVQAKRKQP